LDGRSKSGDTVILTNRDPDGDAFLLWEVVQIGDNYAIKSASSGGYLDGRAKNGDHVLVSVRDPVGDKYLLWEIIPVK